MKIRHGATSSHLSPTPDDGRVRQAAPELSWSLNDLNTGHGLFLYRFLVSRWTDNQSQTAYLEMKKDDIIYGRGNQGAWTEMAGSAWAKKEDVPVLPLGKRN